MCFADLLIFITFKLHEYVHAWIKLAKIYYVRENVQGKIFCDFHGFSLDCKSFPVNYDLVDQQYKSTELLQQIFYRE